MAEAACLTASAYRPRRARDSSLYRLAETHDETFKQLYDERFAERYGAWRAVVERTLFAFLDCGIEEGGFARVRCDVCRSGCSRKPSRTPCALRPSAPRPAESKSIWR